MYTIVCGYCRTPKHVKKRTQKYCSARCYRLAQRAHLTPHQRGYCAVMICAWCCDDFVIRRRPSQRNPWMCCSTRCARLLQGWRRCKRHRGGTRGQLEKLHRMRRRGEITLRCVICGFDRLVEWSHIIPASKGGRYSEHNGLWLCPNHHRLFDRHRLSPDEVTQLPARPNSVPSGSYHPRRAWPEKACDDLKPCAGA